MVYKYRGRAVRPAEAAISPAQVALPPTDGKGIQADLIKGKLADIVLFCVSKKLKNVVSGRYKPRHCTSVFDGGMP